MADRELLELTAKAAKIPFSNIELVWNPLTDDGDALRLAVKLHINIEHLKTLQTKIFNEVAASPHGRGDCIAFENIESDPYAATRRAIVRAAAEIGKGMK
jgi:hypothetical protein